MLYIVKKNLFPYEYIIFFFVLVEVVIHRKLNSHNCEIPGMNI
jgi:hypothetical protein